MNAPIQVAIAFSEGSWIAIATNAAVSSHGRTRRTCLANLAKKARRAFGPQVTLIVEEDPMTIVGVTEVAQILGWDRRKVAVYAKRGHLPKPIAALAGGRVWRRADIEDHQADAARAGTG